MKVSDIILAEKRRAEAIARGVEYEAPTVATTPKEQLFKQAQVLGWTKPYPNSTMDEMRMYIANVEAVAQ